MGPVTGDFAASLVVDAVGHASVTGMSEGVGTGADYATVKYDESGNQLWVSRYDGPGSGWDGAAALAVDGAGNVYVGGGSNGTGTSRDFATIKYDTNGNRLWLARYDGAGTTYDYATASTADGAGNVYVTGCSVCDGGFAKPDYMTIKYDASGNQLWASRYSGPYNQNDDAEALAVDGVGNVYVTGASIASIRYDYATVRYDASGTQVWVARYDGPGNGGDEAKALAVDGAGNVYVTGGSEGSGTGYDYATIKYRTMVPMAYLPVVFKSYLGGW